MAQYPVNDDDSTQDAVNYLLSGPSGLGQFFKGFSSFEPVYLTGNYRPPFTQTTTAELYVAPISLGVSTMLDGFTWKFFFATPQASPPFALGNPITISGVTDSWYDGQYSPIGVIDCTTTYVTVRTNNSYDIHPDSSGGTAEFNNMATLMSTDCNAKVVVTGGTDRVFVSAQLNNIISYSGATSDTLTYTVQVNRYKGYITDDPTNPDYRFILDKTVGQKVYTFDSLSGSGTLPNTETIFSTIIDSPAPWFYWYILEVQYDCPDSSFQVTSNEFDLRSLSAQVVKE